MSTVKIEISNFHLFWTKAASLATAFKAHVGEALRRHYSRRQLAGMPDHLLKDIGISRSEAEQEAAKPFWRE